MENHGATPLGYALPAAGDDTGPIPRIVATPVWQPATGYPSAAPAPLRPASFGIRLAARLVDLAVVALLAVLGYAALFGVMLALGGFTVSGLVYALLAWTLLPSVAWLLYRVLGEGNATGQTLGKAVCGIRVLRVDPPSAQRPGLGRAFLRAVVSSLNVFFFAADLAMLFTADRRTLGDKASGTAVVYTERSQPFGALGSAAVVGLLVCALAVPVAVLGHGIPGARHEQAGGAAGTAVLQSGGSVDRDLGSAPDAPAVGRSVPLQNQLGGSGALESTVASVQVPAQAANGQDGGGNPMNYSGRNMLDGDPSTCWRMDGDGTGTSVRFDLGTARQISAVGMINGYAKTDPYTGVDRYSQERQVVSATWTFDDGSSYSQNLDSAYPDMQSISLPTPATSRTVTLTLDMVTYPGDTDFDYTAISDVVIQGG